jgi:hypothetical protein
MCGCSRTFVHYLIIYFATVIKVRDVFAKTIKEFITTTTKNLFGCDLKKKIK